MKIGILTFHRGPNHGGYLQVYELAKAIESFGHEVEIIDYQNPVHSSNEQFRPWVYRRPSSLWHGWRKHRAFDRAVQKLSLSRRSNEVNWSRYDTIMVGADVVWDYRDPGLGHDPTYFGNFREKFSGTLASYAPSCGTADLSQPIPDWVKSGLAGFDHISVRDITTQKLVKSAIAADSPIVMDPSWLPLRTEMARGLQSTYDRQTEQDYIVVYAHTVDDKSARSVVSYARSKKLKIIASGYPHPWADQFLSGISPLDWVRHVRNANCVFTGTFHGALYATRLGKRFAILSNPRIAAKLETPIKIAGLQSRYVDSAENIPDILEMDRNLEEDLANLKGHVLESWKYLESVLDDSASVSS